MSILADDIDKAKKSLDLQEGTQQIVCFFDTPDHDLAAKYLEFRARYTLVTKKGKLADDDDEDNGTTAKLRPKSGIDRIAEAHFIAAVDGHKDIGKLEKDQAIGKEAVESLSMDSPVLSASTIESVIANPTTAKPLFSAQDAFITAHGGAKWNQLKQVGPIRSISWEKVRIKGVDAPVVVEEWVMKNADQPVAHILEISAKISSAADIAAFTVQLPKALESLQIRQDPSGKMKTTQAFEYFLP